MEGHRGELGIVVGVGKVEGGERGYLGVGKGVGHVVGVGGGCRSGRRGGRGIHYYRKYGGRTYNYMGVWGRAAQIIWNQTAMDLYLDHIGIIFKKGIAKINPKSQSQNRIPNTNRKMHQRGRVLSITTINRNLFSQFRNVVA